MQMGERVVWILEYKRRTIAYCPKDFCCASIKACFFKSVKLLDIDKPVYLPTENNWAFRRPGPAWSRAGGKETYDNIPR